MRVTIAVHENEMLLLREIYSDTGDAKRDSGNQLHLHIRDNIIEMSVPGSERFYHVVMETGEIKET